MILALLACRTSDCVSEPRDFETSLVVAFTDFSVGGLARGDASGVQCPEVGTGGDPAVRSGGGELFGIDRDGEIGDVITAYDPQDLGRPLWQTHLGTGLNPHDVVRWNDALYVPLFDAPRIEVLDAADGSRRAPIDVPVGAALDRAVPLAGALWVADQRFDRSVSPWVSRGVLLEVTDRVVAEIETGPNPRIAPGPAGTLLVATGLLALDDDPVARQDGVLRVFDPVDRSWSAPLITEAELDADIHGVLTVGDRIVVTAVDGAGFSRVHCIGVGDGPSDGAWFVDLTQIDGRVVVASRRSPVGGDDLSERGLFTLDPETCTRIASIPTPDRDPFGIVGL